MRQRGFRHGLAVRRRAIVIGGVLSLVGFGSVRADAVIGTADEVRGTVSRKHQEDLAAVRVGAEIMDRDFIVTGNDSFAALTLGRDTRLFLGSRVELLVDSFIAGQGGTIELGTGALVFERPEGAPKMDVALRTAFGMIGVRGTKFFAGPSRGVFGVFVEHGLVEVTGGGVTRQLAAGDGVDVAAPGAAPSAVSQWGEARIREAYASVGIR